jgi:hypothetical protein
MKNVKINYANPETGETKSEEFNFATAKPSGRSKSGETTFAIVDDSELFAAHKNMGEWQIRGLVWIGQ